ncbi:hypothetical protein EGW08_007778 [Elysia chlorotica]|uniref:Uncharacterized protein n=1 Tax=Elysia chlorotica TaxID=188477 RepID=A0A3S1BIB4_ELYCH|nr:hypothetical protein EGW08_007778 [Elysia chlorotica]
MHRQNQGHLSTRISQFQNFRKPRSKRAGAACGNTRDGDRAGYQETRRPGDSGRPGRPWETLGDLGQATGTQTTLSLSFQFVCSLKRCRQNHPTQVDRQGGTSNQFTFKWIRKFRFATEQGGGVVVGGWAGIVMGRAGEGQEGGKRRTREGKRGGYGQERGQERPRGRQLTNNCSIWHAGEPDSSKRISVVNRLARKACALASGHQR